MHTFDSLALTLRRLDPSQAPADLPDLVSQLDPSQLLSVWAGPDFAAHPQPTLVGEGAALALVAAPAPPPGVYVDESITTSTLINPSRDDVMGLLSARDHVPGDQVRQQPQFSRISRRWQQVVSQATLADEGGHGPSLVAAGLTLPVAFISFGFGPHTPAVAVLPRRTWINFAGEWFVLTAQVNADSVPESVPAGSQPHPVSGTPVSGAPAPALGSVALTPGTMRRSRWKAAVADVIAEIRSGAAQKVVMARDLNVQSQQPLALNQMVSNLHAANPSCWVFAVAGLVGASPEMLASVRGQEVHSRVLAGTCRPGEGELLMRSDKDREEHALAVSSVTGALESMTRTLQADAAPFLLDLAHVTHLATDISGHLESSRGLCDVLAQLHPSAAVCGTPTQDAFEILAAFEATDRGRYCGPVGWMDATGAGACAIALRCGQLDAGGTSIRLFAGGGIMPTSDPDAELAETQAKMAAMLETLGVGSQPN
ncbi:MAG: isochorismate synthase [Actinomycetaceae bacterium]|nr:isochorismate synthase [Actinomycetaceae bacterium]